MESAKKRFQFFFAAVERFFVERRFARRARPLLALTFPVLKTKKKKTLKTDMATYNGIVSNRAEPAYKPMCV